MRMRPFGRLLPLESARRRLLRAAVPIERRERIPLTDALGRVSARTVRAPWPIPRFARATWDGYAFRARESRAASPLRPVELAVVGEVYAEREFSRTLRAREAVAIATGGRIPRGSDTVEIFERVTERPGRIRIDHRVPPGHHVAAIGADLPAGSRLVARRGLLGPAELGALAAIGRSFVEVYARPTVAIVPNGNELRRPGRPLGPNGIYEANTAMLSAVILANGGVPRPYPPVPDRQKPLERALRAAARGCDLVLVTGGSSVGERDLLPELFPRLGELLFHGIAVRPGKPTLATRRGRTLLLGLPGHPTSCLSNGLWLVLPLLRRLARLPGSGWDEVELTLGGDVGRPSPDLSTVVPLRVDGAVGYPTFHDSHAISSLARTGAFAILPPGRPVPRRGQRLRAHQLWPPLRPAG